METIENQVTVQISRDEAKMTELEWGESLQFLLVFTRREIDDHVKKCGKVNGKYIAKTIMRGQTLKQERFLSADSVYTAVTADHFIVKCTCCASMKRLKRSVMVHLNKTHSSVDRAHCTSPAGRSGYCNHVMAALFELADYSLNSLKVVPTERACTSQLRKWGIPSSKGQKNIQC